MQRFGFTILRLLLLRLSLLPFLPFILGFTNDGQPVASSEVLKRASMLERVVPVNSHVRIFFRRDSKANKKYPLLQLSANGEPVALLKKGQYTYLEASFEHDHQLTIEGVSYKDGKIVERSEPIAELSVNTETSSNLFITCGKRPLPKVRDQYFILPNAVCESADAECPTFDKKGRLCKRAQWQKTTNWQMCGASANWREYKKRHLKGSVCTLTAVDPFGKGGLFDATGQWPTKTDKKETKVTDYFKNEMNKLVAVEPLKGRLSSPVEAAAFVAGSINTLAAYEAFRAAHPGGESKIWEAEVDRAVLYLKYKAFKDNPSIELGEAYLAEYEPLKTSSATGTGFLDYSFEIEDELDQLRWQQTIANQKCKAISGYWVHVGDACLNGKIHGNTVLISKNRATQIQGRFENGHLIEGTRFILGNDGQKTEVSENGKSYVVYGSGWKKSYEGGFAAQLRYRKDGSSFMQYVSHGDGREYAVHRTDKKAGSKNVESTYTRWVSYEGGFAAGVRYGDGFCRLAYGGQFEPCRYQNGKRVDEIYKLRQERANLKKQQEKIKKEQQQIAKKVKACETAFSQVTGAVSMAEARLNEPDPCVDNYAMITERTTDSFWLETYDGSRNRVIGEAVYSARHCRKEHDGQFWYWANGVPDGVRKLRTNKCPQLNDTKPYEDYYQQVAKQVERHAQNREDYEEEMLKFERRLVAAGDHRYAQENARWLRELSKKFMQPSEFDRSLEKIQQRTLHNIQQHKINHHKSYVSKGAPTLKSPTSKTYKIVELKKIEKRIEANQKASKDKYAEAKAKCLKQNRKWLGDRCNSKINQTRWPGRACYDPSGQHCKTGETIGARSSDKSVSDGNKASSVSTSTAGSGNSSSTVATKAANKTQAAKKPSRSLPIFVQREGTHGWSSKEEACTYAKQEAIRLAEKRCKLENNGVKATTKDVPLPVDANCQSYRQMEKGGFTHTKGDWKVTGNVILYCRLPES